MLRPARCLRFLILYALIFSALILQSALPAGAQDSRIVFSTYLGGSQWEDGADLAVDALGRIWIAGTTASRDFPGAGTPPVPAPSDFEPHDGFLARLSPEGALLSSSYVGGPLPDSLSGIALDPAGNPWEAGTLLGGSVNDLQDYVLLARGTSFTSFQRFSYSDRGIDLGFDTAGNLYLLGATEFGFDLFVQKRSPGGQEIQVTGLRPDFASAFTVGGDGTTYVLGSGDLIRLDPAGNEHYLPAPLGHAVDDIAADAAGNLHVVGTEEEDLFYAVLNPDGGVITSLRLGGSQGDYGRHIALGPAGDVAILGITESPDFPLVRPLDSACPPSASRPGRCEPTAFVIRLVGGAPVLSTYLDLDLQRTSMSRIALGPRGGIVLAGITSDPAFPAVNAVQPSLRGPSDAFVLRIAGNLPPDCRGGFARPSEIWPPNGRFVPVAIQGITDPEGESLDLVVTAIRQDEPLSKPRVPDASGVGSSSARLRADRAGTGDGRVYSIAFAARDGQGAVCTGTVTVCLPHDRGKRRACANGGPLYDSTRP